MFVRLLMYSLISYQPVAVAEKKKQFAIRKHTNRYWIVNQSKEISCQLSYQACLIDLRGFIFLCVSEISTITHYLCCNQSVILELEHNRITGKTFPDKKLKETNDDSVKELQRESVIIIFFRLEVRILRSFRDKISSLYSPHN